MLTGNIFADNPGFITDADGDAVNITEAKQQGSTAAPVRFTRGSNEMKLVPAGPAGAGVRLNALGDYEVVKGSIESLHAPLPNGVPLNIFFGYSDGKDADQSPEAAFHADGFEVVTFNVEGGVPENTDPVTSGPITIDVPAA